MTIYEHADTIDGLPVTEWNPDEPGCDGVAYAIRIDYDQAEEGLTWVDVFASLLDSVPNEQIQGMVVGCWEEAFDNGASEAIVEALVSASERLPNLRALFFGDITGEECEISWIQQTDISPLFGALPKLEYLRVRGGGGLAVGSIRHASLKTLIVETGGLPGDVARACCAADMPALEHLELWLGTERYGGTSAPEDVAPLLAGQGFPKLRYLGLRDSEIVDQIAPLVASAPITQRIQVLDLSLGTLTDAGAQALLESPVIAKLQKLDLHHHYCSDAMMEQLSKLGPQVDVSDQQKPYNHSGELWRYVAVSE
ncbi:hypothetical protein F8S13_07410 [Chloroflexia bacterium SDU3-3]|nr:hypothetical protein F8S13_07410 [Chloroflexia bacterium SDU3-3]